MRFYTILFGFAAWTFLPSIALGWAFGNEVGLLLALELMLVFLGTLMIFGEQGVSFFLGAIPGPEGIAVVLNEVSTHHHARVLIVPTPGRQTWIARSLFSDGTVFISQGLLSVVSEENLKSLLRDAVQTLSSRGLAWSTFFAVLARLGMGSLPLGWRRLLYYPRLSSLYMVPVVNDRYHRPFWGAGMVFILGSWIKCALYLSEASLKRQERASWGLLLGRPHWEQPSGFFTLEMIQPAAK